MFGSAWCACWTAHIIGRSLKGWALIGYSVIKTCVCLSVRGLQITVFDLVAYFFGIILLGSWQKNCNFMFFEILIFGPLRALFLPFSSIFFFMLCKSSVRATSHTDRLTNLIFGTESLYDTITWGFQRFLKICISAPFRGPYIFKKGPKSQKT